MKKIIYTIPLFFLFAIILSGCSNDVSFKKTIWQGVYYPNGCLSCEENYVYSPAFDNFDDCKTWAFNKKSNSDDKVTCSKNCKNPDEYGMQSCEETIRNWKATPVSTTFEEYQE